MSHSGLTFAQKKALCAIIKKEAQGSGYVPVLVSRADILDRLESMGLIQRHMFSFPIGPCVSLTEAGRAAAKGLGVT